MLSRLSTAATRRWCWPWSRRTPRWQDNSWTSPNWWRLSSMTSPRSSSWISPDWPIQSSSWSASFIILIKSDDLPSIWSGVFVCVTWRNTVAVTYIFCEEVIIKLKSDEVNFFCSMKPSYGRNGILDLKATMVIVIQIAQSILASLAVLLSDGFNQFI